MIKDQTNLLEIGDVVTLCGSTRLKDKFLEVAKQLTFKGVLIFMPHVYGHCGDVVTEADKELLDQLHKTKIDKSDAIIVLVDDAGIGKSTNNEIVYATKHNKPVIIVNVDSTNYSKE